MICRYWIFIAIILSLICTLAFALPKLTIEADYLDYSGVSGFVRASGDVLIGYRGTTGTSNSFYYNIPDASLNFPEHFTLRQKNNSIEGSQFYLSTTKKEGYIDQVKFNIKPAIIRGERIYINPGELVINNGVFTTCDYPDPHYELSAETITAYPLIGMIVIQNAQLKINGIPVFWVPSYIYGGAGLAFVSQTPLPEIYQNADEGIVVKRKFGYFLNRQSAGAYELNYASNYGWGVALEHTQYLNDQLFINLRSRIRQQAEGEGDCRIEQKWGQFMPPSAESATTSIMTDLLGVFTNGAEDYCFTTALEYKVNEYLNQQRISYLPQLEIKSNELGNGLAAAVSVGNVREKNNLQTWRSAINLDAERSFPVLSDLLVTPRILNRFNWYGEGSQWHRTMGVLDLSTRMLLWDVGAGYSFPIFQNGSSPFRFDSYQVIQENELAFSIKDSHQHYGLELYYQLNSRSFRQINYHLGFEFNHWLWKLAWEPIGRTFSFDIALCNMF